jgi:hypothetical protein
VGDVSCKVNPLAVIAPSLGWVAWYSVRSDRRFLRALEASTPRRRTTAKPKRKAGGR